MARDKYDFYLEASNLSDGALQELQIAALQRCGATSDTFNEAWNEFLIARGFTQGGLNDRMYHWLGSRGFTGSLDDRLYKLYQETGGTNPLCPTPTPPESGGAFSDGFNEGFDI